MADQHPYRHDPDSDGEEAEEQVVFAVTKGPGSERPHPEQETTYYLGMERPGDVKPECGFLCLQFPSLGRYATLSTFIIVLTVLCCFQGMFYAFWISIITSIEKQYELSSTEIGLITALGELGKLTTLLGLSFYGELAHRPRWIAISSLALTLSYICILLPDLFAPDSSWKDLTTNEVCTLIPDNTTSSGKCTTFDARTGWRTAGMTIFALAHFVAGCASAIPVMYGVAVIQDHFVRKDSSLYLGVHFVGKVLGPVLGFLLGTLCTAMVVNTPGLSNFSDQDPRWLNIRAWHVTTGILVIALLNVGAAFPMLLFPSEFTIVDPESKPPAKGSVAIHNLSARPPLGYRKPLSLRLVKEDVKKLLVNQIFITRVATVVVNVFVLSGFYVFLPKYLEAQFYAQPNVANLATAIAVLLPTGCGIIVGCFLYRYCDFKPKHSTLITMLTSLLFFAGFLILIAFRCDSRQIAGVKADDGTIDINQGCNSRCNCDDPVFSPVCDVTAGINYYSACRAGCEAVSPINGTHSEPACHCATGTKLGFMPKGFCKLTCNKLWPFVFLLFLILFACSVPTVGSVMLIYRTVPTDLMLMAHIFMATCIGVLALFPSPLVFGGIIDSSCVLWSAQGCSDAGACLVHDNNALAYRVSGTISGMKVLAVLIEIYMFWKSRHLEFDEIEPAIMWSPDAVRLAFTETVGR